MDIPSEHLPRVRRFFASRAKSRKASTVEALHAALGSSIAFDVSMACEDQLTDDGRAPPHDPGGVMSKDYRYNQDGMLGYLTAVRFRLSQKGHTFTFNAAFVVAALADTLSQLKLRITKATT
ncbi:hypothetical protein [Caulobacter sp. BK020]|uniref:hypothetical protein n=1 Tax=Caulobacter sp. BK020 TaxID=2512117 RepID=UPI00104C8BE1|nr:hypothetical protein [Caulobacter sp. BK020]TCS10307.1 hypothetical protein EV278_11844 [Caulobacter sp. BK020]